MNQAEHNAQVEQAITNNAESIALVLAMVVRLKDSNTNDIIELLQRVDELANRAGELEDKVYGLGIQLGAEDEWE